MDELPTPIMETKGIRLAQQADRTASSEVAIA